MREEWGVRNARNVACHLLAALAEGEALVGGLGVAQALGAHLADQRLVHAHLPTTAHTAHTAHTTAHDNTLDRAKDEGLAWAQAAC